MKDKFNTSLKAIPPFIQDYFIFLGCLCFIGILFYPPANHQDKNQINSTGVNAEFLTQSCINTDPYKSDYHCYKQVIETNLILNKEKI